MPSTTEQNATTVHKDNGSEVQISNGKSDDDHKADDIIKVDGKDTRALPNTDDYVPDEKQIK